MNWLKPLRLICLLPCALFINTTWSAECKDVIWSHSVTEQYPNIDQHCQDVVGEHPNAYVKLEAKFLSAHAGKIKLKFKHSDGSYGETFRTGKLDQSFRVILDGRQTKVSEIPRNSQLTLYMPPDRFHLVGNISDLEALETVAVLYAYDNELLPGTGSNLPLLLLFGLVACLMGLFITATRLRQNT